ncbi:hypothetical protein B296_00011991 [Ensete ventricosum]|uniref:Uncharacterized protein n=1 Tax=Ensete ventricosum TaxID=4639 RepID=A0A426ZF30_ENSVE|nr:hypothetical protein B296_00011991 [Ensete ventricosum]
MDIRSEANLDAEGFKQKDSRKGPSDYRTGSRRGDAQGFPPGGAQGLDTQMANAASTVRHAPTCLGARFNAQ